MTPFQLTPCTAADGTALAATCIPAFWADPHWVLAWRHRTLEQHVAQIALRFPHNLLNNRAALRHQKVVDPDTGRFLGYARWCLPPGYETTGLDGTTAWPEAQVPPVEPEVEAEIRRVAETVVWDPNEDADALLDRVNELKRKVTPQTPFLSLEYLAVHPDNHRRGIGSALVRSGMEQAEKMGLDIFVHAMREGAQLYKRLGFRLIAELIQDDSAYGGSGEYGAWFFIYEQKPASRSPGYVQ